MDAPLCEKCKLPMAKGPVLNSGNAKYLSFACAKCKASKTVCIGVNG